MIAWLVRATWGRAAVRAPAGITAALGCAFALASCATTPPVLAPDDAALARLVAAVLATEVPAIEIRRLDAELPGPFRGRFVAARRPYIELGLESRPEERAVLAHELAHWAIHRSRRIAWKRLPPLLQEGLCELVALRAEPELAAERVVNLLALLEAQGALRDVEVRLASDPLPHRGADASDAAASYLLGWAVAVRLGVRGLAELCEKPPGRGSIGARDVLARAGLLSEDPGVWKEALRFVASLPVPPAQAPDWLLTATNPPER
jgi:hypothetical protein